MRPRPGRFKLQSTSRTGPVWCGVGGRASRRAARHRRQALRPNSSALQRPALPPRLFRRPCRRDTRLDRRLSARLAFHMRQIWRRRVEPWSARPPAVATPHHLPYLASGRRHHDNHVLDPVVRCFIASTATTALSAPSSSSSPSSSDALLCPVLSCLLIYELTQARDWLQSSLACHDWSVHSHVQLLPSETLLD